MLLQSKTTQDSVMQMVLHCLIDQLGKNTFAKIISFEQVKKNNHYYYNIIFFFLFL